MGNISKMKHNLKTFGAFLVIVLGIGLTVSLSRMLPQFAPDERNANLGSKYGQGGWNDANSQPPAYIPGQQIMLTGTYDCLPHRGVKPGEPQTAECAAGLRTAEGNYYALNFAASSRLMPHNIFPGDEVRADGIITPIVQGEDLYRHEADYLLSVTAFARVEHEKNGMLYSSIKAQGEIFVDAPAPNAKLKLPLEVRGRVSEAWLSRGQWGTPGTLRLMLEDKNGLQVSEETAASRIDSGRSDDTPAAAPAAGMVPFRAVIRYGEHTQADGGYIVIYQSNFSGRREYVKVPVSF